MQNERVIDERLEQIAEMIQNTSGFLDNLDIAIPKSPVKKSA